jgi:hypothetical protein
MSKPQPRIANRKQAVEVGYLAAGPSFATQYASMHRVPKGAASSRKKRGDELPYGATAPEEEGEEDVESLTCDYPDPGEVSSDQHQMNFMQLARAATREVRNQVASHIAHRKNVLSKQSRGKSHGTRILQGNFLDVIPDRIRVTLKFALSAARSSAAGPAYYEFEPSDARDLGAGEGSHQPVGFDQWLAFYNKFIVMRSRSTVRTQSNVPLLTGICLGNTTLSSTGNIERVAMQPRSHIAMYEPQAHNPPLETRWVSHNEIYGLTVDEFRANEDFYGTASAGPANDLFLTYYLQVPGIGGNTTAFAANYMLVIELDIEFNERLDLASS